MEDLPLIESPLYPSDINIIAIPNDDALKRAYDTYKPSTQTIKLLSEQGRSVYAEAFFENTNHGTLVNLCVRVLAQSFGPQPMPVVACDPLLLQVHYDALDVELPLAQCHHITEERFWKRLVLTKHKDKSLAAQRNVNWKELGISLKYVELVEECPAEYWHEDEMKELALKVNEFVKEMQIKRLQSLKERSFEKYFLSESESSMEEEESNDEDSATLLSTTAEEDIDAEEDKTESQLELARKEMAIKQALRRKERQELRAAKQKAREVKEAKRKLRKAKQAGTEPVKKVHKKNPDNVFDIELSESEDDGEDRIIDKRNKSLLLKHIKKYNYPAKDCHHIDLSFVQYFTNLETFVLEFWGPLQQRNYHVKHMNFSYEDIQRLSHGLSHLPHLATFRLRNSRMDSEKLLTLCRALGPLPCLKTLDFGYDRLADDCGLAFEELFQTTTTLLNLELESNNLGEQVLNQIGKALKEYKANELLYLGLARNPITDKALHNLTAHVIGTHHINQLNIRGAIFVTDIGVSCCVAQELLRHHTPLIKLDICAIKISPRAADEIVKSLAENTKILEIYCCACELDEESEIDISVLLRRNKYIAENYYLGDSSVTNEEIEQWLSRTKNPILLKVLAERENHQQCLQLRSLECIPSSSILNSETASHHPPSHDIMTQMYDRHLKEYSSAESHVALKQPERFVYAANDFDEQQFFQHVSQPGPQERYYYFKIYKEKYAVKDNVKNISMI